MTILLYKDGHLVIDDGNPLEGVSLDGLVACVSNPQDGDTLVYNATAGIWVPGNPMPVSITEPEDGDTLAYDAESGKWVNVHAAAGGE
ncbi:MAG: hypothetical protein II008_20425 [Oscillospiraceae bacterium]|nr:hypothetical protein [Clostridia bacterium]MBQ1792552.1 hypothetical protein [Oscillospiraceae bacterium]